MDVLVKVFEYGGPFTHHRFTDVEVAVYDGENFVVVHSRGRTTFRSRHVERVEFAPAHESQPGC